MPGPDKLRRLEASMLQIQVAHTSC